MKYKINICGVFVSNKPFNKVLFYEQQYYYVHYSEDNVKVYDNGLDSTLSKKRKIKAEEDDEEEEEKPKKKKKIKKEVKEEEESEDEKGKI